MIDRSSQRDNTFYGIDLQPAAGASPEDRIQNLILKMTGHKIRELSTIIGLHPFNTFQYFGKTGGVKPIYRATTAPESTSLCSTVTEGRENGRSIWLLLLST